jgi:hypothetical protein
MFALQSLGKALQHVTTSLTHTTTMADAKTIVLKANLDEGMPEPEHFTVESKPAPSVPADGILIQALVFSADPYLVSAQHVLWVSVCCQGFFKLMWCVVRKC